MTNKITAAQIKEAFDRHSEYLYIPFSAEERIKKQTGAEDVLFAIHETGGVSGGSCWDSSNPQPYTNSEPDPGLSILDDILEELCPNITFLKYRKILKNVHSIEHTCYEYYGNRTEYRVYFITYEDILAVVNSD